MDLKFILGGILLFFLGYHLGIRNQAMNRVEQKFNRMQVEFYKLLIELGHDDSNELAEKVVDIKYSV